MSVGTGVNYERVSSNKGTSRTTVSGATGSSPCLGRVLVVRTRRLGIERMSVNAVENEQWG